MTGRWSLPPLSIGEFIPGFQAPSHGNPNYAFDTVAGRHVVLAFLPDTRGPRAAALAAFESVRSRFDDEFLAAFFVSRAPGPDTEDRIPGQRFLFDPKGEVSALFGGEPGWFLLDPMLRVLARAPLDAPQTVLGHLASLPPLGVHAAGAMVAPVLLVPRVFEPELCQRLVALHEAEGGAPSGVMREMGGKTVGVLDEMKSRRDVTIEDPELRALLRERLNTNLIPMLRRGLQFRATRLERYIVAAYDAAEGGRFRPHRDNTTAGTAHRRFACSINLNAEDFEGGDLRFPEFGPRTYRPPTGGAVVFCCSLLHEATRVTRGRRYAFLPFLYDEEGHRIRQQNLRFLETASG